MSARNQRKGTVKAINLGAVMADITIDIGSEQTLSSAITRQSVERLGLEVGDQVVAIPFATFLPMLPAGTTPLALPPALDLRDQIIFGAGVVVRDGRQRRAAQQIVDFPPRPSRTCDPRGSRGSVARSGEMTPGLPAIAGREKVSPGQKT